MYAPYGAIVGERPTIDTIGMRIGVIMAPPADANLPSAVLEKIEQLNALIQAPPPPGAADVAEAIKKRADSELRVSIALKTLLAGSSAENKTLLPNGSAENTTLLPNGSAENKTEDERKKDAKELQEAEDEKKK